MTGNIYLDLTGEFNDGFLRAILSGNQAVVVHGVVAPAIYGDWIVRETPESLDFILSVLERHGARYRMGAPLDVRWMGGGWSAHFEFLQDGIRIRCDFVTRPPRLAAEDLAAMWEEHERGQGLEEPVPTLDLRRLAELKKTDRERDYSFIGEIARRLPLVSQQILFSRSARDLIALWPQLGAQEQEGFFVRRSLLREIPNGRRALQAALDSERFDLMERNERRLAVFDAAASSWIKAWSSLKTQVALLPLSQAHLLIVDRAEELLPENPHE